MLAKANQIVERMLECRTTAHTLLGDRYEERIEPIRAELRRLVKEDNVKLMAIMPAIERGELIPGPALLESPLIYMIAATADVAEEKTP